MKDRVHHLIDQFNDEELEKVWEILQELYYDCYLLKAVQVAKESVQPGDTLTRDEAIRYLQS
nr:MULTISPECIES: hypothetical protein [unclassified Desertifilum]